MGLTYSDGGLPGGMLALYILFPGSLSLRSLGYPNSIRELPKFEP